GAPSADDWVALDARVLPGDEETLNGLPGVHVVELLLGRGVADECVGRARLVVTPLTRLVEGPEVLPAVLALLPYETLAPEEVDEIVLPVFGLKSLPQSLLLLI